MARQTTAMKLATGAAIALAAGGCAATRRPIVHAHQRAAAHQRATAHQRAAAQQRTAAHAPAAHAPAGPRPQPVGSRPAPRAPLQAFVTAPAENRLLVVDLPSGRVVRRITIAGEPEYAAAGCGVVVVASAAAGTVTILDQPSMRTIRVIHGFVSPHIPALAPGCDDAYVTDDATGVLTAVDLGNDRVASRTAVGDGAHHLALGTHALHIWVALGQAAPTVAMLSTIVATPPRPSSPVQDPGRPHVTADWRPPFLVHDLLYSPDGRRVWVTSADTTYVGVFDARNRRLLFRVPAGAPPQHVVFAGASAYITSGYGSMIERVSLTTGRVLARAHAPYGSFDLDAGGGYVVAASLFEGTIAVYDRRLRPLRVRQLATSAEDVSISPPSSVAVPSHSLASNCPSEDS